MRLDSIKLSGFKSFAEPTNFVLPGRLIGVVGPNGCGKSNVMDAVRWVLGESRASELRGQSMQDVIFNGTTARKAASRTMVELVFDNSDHRAGGQWNQFSELAVRRVLTRDGASSYYINNQLVRRRDVHDVFLGTGLGPRAYAIIGQGTISRIIESRPEDLRLFLEEAAGVSKYKERRRETENRLRDTRENLDRVQDILRELTRNLSKLERQATVARRYRELQAECSLRQNQLWFLKRRHSQHEAGQLHAQVRAQEQRLQETTTELRKAQAELERTRQAHYAAGEELNQAQAQLYEASAEVGKLEAQIRYVAEGRERVRTRQQQLQARREQWQQRQSEARQQMQDLQQQEIEARTRLQALSGELQEQEQQLPALAQALEDARSHELVQRDERARLQQQQQVLAAQQRAREQQREQARTRRQRLQDERGRLVVPETSELERRRTLLREAQRLAAAQSDEITQLQQELAELEPARDSVQEQLRVESARLAQLSARLETLQALQAQVDSSDDMQRWLRQHGLSDARPLWSRLQVEPGWERALEAALQYRVAALPQPSLDAALELAAQPPPQKLSLHASAPGAAAPAAADDQHLARRVRVHDATLRELLDDWLAGCLTASSLPDAVQQRDRLAAGQRIYVPQGHCVQRGSVDFYAPDSRQDGLLERAAQIEQGGKQLRAQELVTTEVEARLQRSRAALAGASQRLSQLRRDHAGSQRQVRQLELEILNLQQRRDSTHARQQQIDEELAELDEFLAQLGREHAQGGQQLQALDHELVPGQQRLSAATGQVARARQQHEAARERRDDLRARHQQQDFARQGLRARQAELARAMEAAARQLEQLQQEQEGARSELEQLSDAAAQAGLQDALELKLNREQALAARRSSYDDLSARLRAQDEQRLVLEQTLDPVRERIGQLQLQEQAARLGAQQYDQLLADAEADLESVAASVQRDEVVMEGLQESIDAMQVRIRNLGAVNLAALEELGEARERKAFLDAQSEDLGDAMQTLEAAIRKIDGETRAMLAQTFEAVNKHFGQMFPQLFGGGQARLVLTGEEILEAGVEVFAQPPGKKNQTIRLLSGGEKALTAIALVFAIFQLNPAPFCLLDEVDAPLDDANTTRYARLIETMSQQGGTQFLFISHNKIAMEMADQLIGVTMQEQGVSRIVAVDMQQAVAMAEAA